MVTPTRHAAADAATMDTQEQAMQDTCYACPYEAEAYLSLDSEACIVGLPAYHIACFDCFKMLLHKRFS